MTLQNHDVIYWGYEFTHKTQRDWRDKVWEHREAVKQKKEKNIVRWSNAFIFYFFQKRIYFYVSWFLTKYKKNDQTKEQLIQYLVDGITIGTPEKIIKGLDEYIDIGVNHFIIHFKELNDITLKLFYSKVISKI